MATTHHPTRKLLFQCPLCKELVHLQRFSAEKGRLCIECPACLQQAVYTADIDISPLVDLPRSPSPSFLSLETKVSTSAVDHILPTLPNPGNNNSTDSHTSPTALEIEEPAVQKPAIQEPAIEAPREPVASVVGRLAAAQGSTAQSSDPQESDVDALESDVDAFCPKCWEKRRVENSSCHKCGLVFANIGVTFDPNKDAVPSGPTGREARALWTALLVNWEEEPLHKQFLQFCQSQGLLEFAAQCYRKERAKRGESALIDAQLERLLDMAQQQFLQANKANAEPVNSATRLVVLLLMLLGGGTLLVMLLRFWQSGGGWNP